MNGLEQATIDFLEENGREPTREEALDISRGLFDHSLHWHNQELKCFTFKKPCFGAAIFTGLFFTLAEAEKAFTEATGLNSRMPDIGFTFSNVTVLDVCMASGMFTSKSAAIKAIKARGIKVCRVQADPPAERKLAGGGKVLEFEVICKTDFFNAKCLPHGMDTFKEHRNFITLHFGKTGKILKISPQGITPIMGI